MGNNRKDLDLILKLWPYRFGFAKLSKIPVIGPFFMKKGVAQGDQVTLIPVNRSLEPIQNVPLPENIVDDFIRRSSHRVILHSCPCREGEGCKEFPISVGCLFLGEGAREIDPSLGREVSVEEALEHERKARAAGLTNLIGRAKFDALWLGVKKHESLLTICNCCPCCCVLSTMPHLSPDVVDKILVRLEGLELKVEGSCTGCKICLDSCLFGAMEVRDGAAFITERCKGCGRCRDACPDSAISMRFHNPAFIEECTRRISSVFNG